ncbi:hypothetical protein L9F63_014988 [Diploptera punctata]|uniref:Ubiquitin-like domain-containing protein n=1 Tax=Diploptera punctata TaxID=6984 RepID=A0AAD8EKS4_DIPPU|nr:hypothetical protein L9F63_014988 [Diploptera punctata]
MTLIEGVGDEVTHFFLLVMFILVGAIAWWSTSIADQPLIRTVLILERRSRHRVTTEPTSTPPSTTTTSIENSIDTGQLEATDSGRSSQQELDAGATCQICDKESSTLSSTSTSTGVEQSSDSGETSSTDSCTRVENLTENGNSPNIQLLNDPESNILRNRRLAFFQNRRVTLLESETVPNSVSYENVEISNSLSQATEEDIPTSMNDNSPSAGSIRIRLKYLNDDQKLVEGKLQEQLGDFKRRHFSLELSGDKLVRLIFNGQVLQSDNETLQGYGLFDNCVVHCLVHQQYSGSTNQAGSTENHDSAANSNLGDAAHRDWDLGSVLFASLSLLLGLAWYCRYQYAQLFNATTTVALVGLTGILTVSLVGIYLPDHDGLRH